MEKEKIEFYKKLLNEKLLELKSLEKEKKEIISAYSQSKNFEEIEKAMQNSVKKYENLLCEVDKILNKISSLN